MARFSLMFVSLLMLVSLVFASDYSPVDTSIRPYQVESSANGLTLQFDEINVSWLAADGGGEMPTLDGAGEIGVAGGPRLPVYSELIAVPEGMDLVLLNVYAHWRDLGVHELAYDTGQEGESTRDEMIFNRIIQESEETVVVGTTGRWRDLRISAVSVRPMRIDAVTGHVMLAEDLEIEFGYEPSTSFDEEIDPPGVSEAMLPLYEEYVVNALDFIDYSEVVRGTYLMIYPPNWLADVETLAEWRTKTGFTVQMASTEVTGNDFMSIYNYIFGVYETANPPLEYVVLVGDMDDYPNIATAYIDPGVPFPYDPDIATDQKYTYSLTGTSYEAVLPRFLIGRMSVDTQSELRALVNKIKQYEITPFDGNPDRWLRAVTIANTTSSISTALTQDWVAYKMVNNGFTNVEQLVKTWSYDPGTQAVANAINDNVSWVTYRGFGSHTSWAGPYFYNSDIDSRIFNTDNVPVITSMVCGGGAFDELASDPCFGEKWIRHGTHSNLMGAVAFVGPSEIDTHTRWNNMILGGWYTALYDQGLRTLGQCLISAKIQLYNNYPLLWNYSGSNENSVWFYFHSYNILGDPALQLRAEMPKILNVVHPMELMENDTYAEILVQDEFGMPIDNAMVVITKDGNQMIGQATTHPDGVADVLLYEAPESQYLIELTVTRPDVEPYLYSFNGGGNGIVNLIGVEAIEDASDAATNDDGFINPGELINPAASLEVAESGGLNGVMVSLSVPDEYATLETSFQQFGSLGEDDVFLTDDLRIRLNTSVPNGTRIPVSFQITSDEGSQTHQANLAAVNTTEFSLASLQYQDDFYPGDQAYVDISLDNLEELVSAGSVTGTLTIFDSFVSVEQANGAWPAINGGATNVHMTQMFELSADASAYPGHTANGIILLTTDRGFEQTIEIEFVVMGAGPNTPTGPVGPAYYIFEDTDTGYEFTPDMTWESIVGNGGWDIGLDDRGNNEDDVVTIDLPFAFPYWDQVYDQISVCSNGWLSMGDSDFYFFRNRPIPGPLAPFAGIMPFWDDLVFDNNNSGVYAKHDEVNGWFTVEWYRVWHANDMDWWGNLSGPPMYFGVRFFDPAVHGAPSDLGMIGIIYPDIRNEDINENYLTMGITSPDGREGLQYEFGNVPAPTASGVEDGRQLIIAAAYSLEPAHLSFTPPLIQMNAETGQTDSGELIITNDGGRSATFDIWPEGISASWGLPPEIDDFGEADDRGYRWYDSREDFGPEYQWINIAQPGNLVALNAGDGNGYGSLSEEIQLPWAFDFYGTEYNSLWICESGYVTFDEPGEEYGSSSNTSLPRPYAPKPAIFPYWDNIGTDEGGNIYASQAGGSFVVTWNDVHHLEWATNDGPYRFQLVLTADGAIHTQYAEMSGDVNSATIGINDENGSNGLLTAFNTGVPSFMEPELTVRFSPGLPWLTVNPGTHSLNPGESITVQLIADSDGLEAGVQSGRLLLLSLLNEESHAIPIDFLVSDDQLGYAPIINEISGESIEQGDTFHSIPLDPYVEDWDNADAELTWTTYGSDSLTVSIDNNRVATISADPEWAGPATVYFRVNDPELNNAFVAAVFDTENNNDPPIFMTASPDALGLTGSGSTVTFSVTVEDPEEDDVNFEWYHDGSLIGSGNSAEILFEDFGETTVRVVAYDDSGESSDLLWTGNVFDVGVSEETEEPLPDTFTVESIYPNPFNANVVLSYALPRSADVQLVVYNLLGQEVTRQILPATPAGRHQIVLDATRWASGLYFMDWRAGDVRQVRKAVLLK